MSHGEQWQVHLTFMGTASGVGCSGESKSTSLLVSMGIEIKACCMRWSPMSSSRGGEKANGASESSGAGGRPARAKPGVVVSK